MTIYLIRHGKTEANEKHIYCGSTDIPLTDAGRKELENLHYDIENVHFLTSGMRRTDETLRILFGNVPFGTEPRFRELDFGIFEMHSYEELKDTAAYQTWLSGDNQSNIAPSGESGVQMQRRILEAFSEIREDTCVVTHGGVIAVIMEYLFPEENKKRYQWQPKPGGNTRSAVEVTASCLKTFSRHPLGCRLFASGELHIDGWIHKIYILPVQLFTE